MRIYLESGVNGFHSPPTRKPLTVKCSELWLTEDCYCSSPPCHSPPMGMCASTCVYTFIHVCWLLHINPSEGKEQLCLFFFHVFGTFRYIGALGARVICDNIPGLVNKQRQLCQRHPDIMQAIGEGTKEWIRECQHQFRHHRWNCSTLDRDHTVFGRVLLRSKSVWLSRDPLMSVPILTCLLHFFTRLYHFCSSCGHCFLYVCWFSVFIVTNGLL